MKEGDLENQAIRQALAGLKDVEKRLPYKSQTLRGVIMGLEEAAQAEYPDLEPECRCPNCGAKVYLKGERT